MMIATGDFGKLSLEDLIETARSHVASDLTSLELRAELDRRNIVEQIAAAKAQVRTARWQIAIAVAMYLTLLATVAALWIKP
jgi:hypothetical protein